MAVELALEAPKSFPANEPRRSLDSLSSRSAPQRFDGILEASPSEPCPRPSVRAISTRDSAASSILKELEAYPKAHWKGPRNSSTIRPWTDY